MSKIRLRYIEFKYAKKTTGYSYTVSCIGSIVGMISGFLLLMGIAAAFDGDKSAVSMCLVAIGLFFGYHALSRYVIYPWLYKRAEQERIEFFERLRKANEDPQ